MIFSLSKKSVIIEFEKKRILIVSNVKSFLNFPYNNFEINFVKIFF